MVASSPQGRILDARRARLDAEHERGLLGVERRRRGRSLAL